MMMMMMMRTPCKNGTPNVPHDVFVAKFGKQRHLLQDILEDVVSRSIGKLGKLHGPWCHSGNLHGARGQ